MKIWTKPEVREQEVGLEVTSYLPAEIDLIKRDEVFVLTNHVRYRRGGRLAKSAAAARKAQD